MLPPLTLGRTHLDASSASMQAEIAADRARVDAAAACFRIHVAANVVDPNRTSAAGSVNAARDTRRRDAATISFHLHPIHISRHVDGEITREAMRAATLPIAHDPRRVAAHVSADLVGVEFSPGLVFRAAVGTIMNNVVDGRLRAALYANCADIHLYAEILCRG